MDDLSSVSVTTSVVFLSLFSPPFVRKLVAASSASCELLTAVDFSSNGCAGVGLTIVSVGT